MQIIYTYRHRHTPRELGIYLSVCLSYYELIPSRISSDGIAVWLNSCWLQYRGSGAKSLSLYKYKYKYKYIGELHGLYRTCKRS